METGRGISNDDLEKQLQEEEAKMGINNETKENTESKKENPEAVEEAKETAVEKELNTQMASLERNVETVQKTVEEIGGPEVIKEVLSKISPEDKKVLEEKTNRRKNKNIGTW